MRILLASSNPGKIKEIKAIYQEYDIVALKDFEKEIGYEIEVTENQATYEANAKEKCNCLYKEASKYDANIICMADDSGISIDALDGFPGVHTARWLDKDDHEKNLELLKKMQGEKQRNCEYTTVIACIYRSTEMTCQNTLNGQVAYECIGDKGFGFDEIFMLSSGLTLAQLSFEEKNMITPRKKSLEDMKEKLGKYINK